MCAAVGSQVATVGWASAARRLDGLKRRPRAPTKSSSPGWTSCPRCVSQARSAVARAASGAVRACCLCPAHAPRPHPGPPSRWPRHWPAHPGRSAREAQAASPYSSSTTAWSRASSAGSAAAAGVYEASCTASSTLSAGSGRLGCAQAVRGFQRRGLGARASGSNCASRTAAAQSTWARGLGMQLRCQAPGLGVSNCVARAPGRSAGLQAREGVGETCSVRGASRTARGQSSGSPETRVGSSSHAPGQQAGSSGQSPMRVRNPCPSQP